MFWYTFPVYAVIGPGNEVDGDLVVAITPRQQPGVDRNINEDLMPPGAFLPEQDFVPATSLTKLKTKLLR